MIQRQCAAAQVLHANPNRPVLLKQVVDQEIWCILAVIPRAVEDIWATNSALT